jgi:hypothetical protein
MKWLSLLFACLLSTVVYADDVIRESANGSINWSEGVIYAQGFGTSREGMPEAQRKLLARRAAVVDAQRNLLEMTKGVRLTSMTKVVDQIVDESTMATRVQGVIKGATPVKEHYHNDIYTITMAMSIGGELLYAVMPSSEDLVFQSQPKMPEVLFEHVSATLNPAIIWIENQLFSKAFASQTFTISGQQEADTARRIIQWIEQAQPNNVSEALRQSVNDFASGEFSGLLIDASAVSNFELATIPTIRDEAGAVIYPTKETSFADIANKRGVSYDFDINDAVRNARVAQVPMIVKATDTYEGLRSDLVISTAAAERILASKSARQAMNEAGVMIVVAL